jgi:hypothetical protein
MRPRSGRVIEFLPYRGNHSPYTINQTLYIQRGLDDLNIPRTRARKKASNFHFFSSIITTFPLNCSCTRALGTQGNSTRSGASAAGARWIRIICSLASRRGKRNIIFGLFPIKRQSSRNRTNLGPVCFRYGLLSRLFHNERSDPPRTWTGTKQMRKLSVHD